VAVLEDPDTATFAQYLVPVQKPLSLVNSLVLVGTVILAVTSVEAFAVNVLIVVPFF